MFEAASDHPSQRLEAVLVWWGRVAVVMVLGVAVGVWVGWAMNIEVLIRVSASWPPMAPWSALFVAMLAVAIRLQSGRTSKLLVRVSRWLAILVGALAAALLVEYVTGVSIIGLDQMWFPETVNSVYTHWPGRPGPKVLVACLLLSTAVALMRQEIRSAHPIWALCLLFCAALMAVDLAAYLFGAHGLVITAGATGTSILTSTVVLLLAAGTFMERPDRNPVAWLLARTDSRALFRMLSVLAGIPVLIAVLRSILMTSGFAEESADALGVAAGAGVAAAIVFYLSQHEHSLFLERETLSRKRVAAEARYRLLADNSVDIVVQLRGREVVWISPSVEAAFGWPPDQWIGTDFSSRIHPDDLDSAEAGMREIAHGRPAFTRCRVIGSDGGYRWIDGHGKSFVDDEGNADGIVASVRVVDDQVEAQQQLERLARFDNVTGLVNRAEALARLRAALACCRTPGPNLGVLFCDVDQFKQVNDTWGHHVGDFVLTTLAARIGETIREGDTAGRTGGDEILVLLPGVHGLDEVVRVAEKIRHRAAEPIHHDGQTLFATLSIGATLAIPGESATDVTARADGAMYDAKQQGGDTVTGRRATHVDPGDVAALVTT